MNKMVSLNELLENLNYAQSSHYRPTDGVLDADTAHIFRAAHEAGVKGIYVIEASPNTENKILAARPTVYIAEADTIEKAREIHRSLWNLGYAPFIIVRLPHQIRIYTGFNYREDTDDGLLDQINLNQLNKLLTAFKAESVDTGHIWKSNYAKEINPDQRVDKRLLKNLEQLGDALKKDNVFDASANALIGKYVYFSYLRDRQILSDEWLKKKQINPEAVFSNNATINGLRQLIDELDVRFNGKIFPLDFDKETTIQDKHVSWVASVFNGTEIIKSAPQTVHQLHLPFKAYNFNYIPVETLSAIYEQFIFERKRKGAIYTPEILADYLLSEMEWAKPLVRGMKILDPACGSGVFLVLAYRRLIEKEMQLRHGQKLRPEELRDILLESIYGVERETDACYVTEFSLILTLLHYVNVEPPDLKYFKFKFPELHNRQIFESDFFDFKGEKSESNFWQTSFKFDWIIGNPPWTKANQKLEKFAYSWINNSQNKIKCPVGGKRIAEAFSWIVTELLNGDGIVGLVIPATSLFNLESARYRQTFFTKQEVLRITNFSNLRDILFHRRATLPAATIVYRKSPESREKPNIIHYGPFSVNQITGNKNLPWIITINENEITTISPFDAARGNTSLWKFALWGTYYDKRTIERIKYLFPGELKKYCLQRNWSFYEGSQLRNRNEEDSDKLEYVPDIKGKKYFQSDLMRQFPYHFSISKEVLYDIPDEMCYIRKQGGMLGLTTTWEPHIVLSPSWGSYATYSNQDFVIPARQMGIAAPKNDRDNLKALSVYMASSLVAYYLFFNAQEWGVFRQAKRVSTSEVGKIPVPDFTKEQVIKLIKFHKELVDTEKQGIIDYIAELREGRLIKDVDGLTLLDLTKEEKKKTKSFALNLQTKLQEKIDDIIFDLFNIPADIRTLVTEFIKLRLPLDKPNAVAGLIKAPNKSTLEAYANMLTKKLDDFAMGKAFHRVSINQSTELIECIVEISQEKPSVPVVVKTVDSSISAIHAELSDNLREQFSQWVYVQRGLRLFDGPKIHIYKAPRLIDWTQTQAMNDAGDIIGEVISQR